MKTLFNKFLFVATLSSMLWACKKEGQLVTLGTGTPAVITTSATSVVLTKPNLANVAVTVSVAPADFGFDAAVTNTLQIAKTGTSFASPKEVIMSTGATSKSFTHLEMNNLLLSMGLAPEVAGSIDIRLKSTISTSVNPIYSNVKAVTATPFALIGILYMAGAHNGWTFANDSVVSPEGDGIYSAIIQFKQSKSMFKLSKTKEWSNVYGSSSEDVISALLVGPGDIPKAIVGPDLTSPYTTLDNYKVVANTNTLAISYEIFSWGLIGSATPGGWNDDTPMKYNNTTKTWSLTVNLTAGDIKFRKNHNWGLSLGGSNGNLTSDNGPNIPVTAGNYTIVANINEAAYNTSTYTITKNN
ncbi:MAG: hypothetical protein RL363_1379 [Bacteroidota bacterium]